LVYPTGYMANLGAISTIAKKDIEMIRRIGLEA